MLLQLRISLEIMERAVIVDTKNVSQGNALIGGTIETTDKVYLLSVDELKWFENAGLGAHQSYEGSRPCAGMAQPVCG